MSAFNVSLRLELCGGVSLPAVLTILSKYWGQVNVLAHFARSKKIETVETHHRSILPLILCYIGWINVIAVLRGRHTAETCFAIHADCGEKKLHITAAKLS